MIWLGQQKAGTPIPWALRFHDDTGNNADPTTPTARLRALDGTWSNLTTPAKMDATTGLFGGVIDTTGQAAGVYLVNVTGAVATGKTVGAVIGYQIIDNTEADVMARLGTPAGASMAADIATINGYTDTVESGLSGIATDLELIQDGVAETIVQATAAAGSSAEAATNAANAATAATDALNAISGAIDAANNAETAANDAATKAEAARVAASAAAGTGAIQATYFVPDADGNPIADVDVFVTTDEDGTVVVASGKTDNFGLVDFMLDAGTYYFFRQKAGVNFANPDEKVVS